MDRDFSNDVAFLEKHVDVIMLSSDESLAKVAVVPQYQGRVMTSTASGEESFGWLNYEAIASNARSRYFCDPGNTKANSYAGLFMLFPVPAMVFG